MDARQPSTDTGLVLVVDDEPANLRLLRDLLVHAGFEVVTAADGAAAIAKIDPRVPDVLLLDVLMPGKSGYEVCRELRARPDCRIRAGARPDGC